MRKAARANGGMPLHTSAGGRGGGRRRTRLGQGDLALARAAVLQEVGELAVGEELQLVPHRGVELRGVELAVAVAERPVLREAREVRAREVDPRREVLRGGRLLREGWRG
jgi:hypothetical protein